MNVKTFIDRPILSGVVSVFITLLGGIALAMLPIEQFPEIAPPTINVFATYTGANAETVLKSVVVPLEEAINGVENMTYMVSTASNAGQARIDIFFKQGTDPNMAHVNVQNRISQAQGKLPSDVTKGGVTVRRRQPSTLKQIGLYSPNETYDNIFINNYFKINIEPLLARVEGVGEVNINGSDYAMRIWLNPEKMATYGLTPKDVINVLDEQNVEAATGTLGENSDNTYQYVLKYRGRYETEEEFANMVVRSLPDGSTLRLRDIGEISLGAQKYDIYSEVNGKPGALCTIAQSPGSNANATITRIDKVLEQIEKDLPHDLVLVNLQSTKDFVNASIHEVILTLVIAIFLVVLVIYVFLQDMRATLIPTITIFISLIGTFFFMYLFGFSINTLTLFALVLVIGTVVDDAIVVVEAIQARFDAGERSPYRAAVDAMKGLSMTLITTSVVFMAVFIPVCFMGGTTGVFYKQFGITMAVAVCLSLVNAMTLSPVLSSIILTSPEVSREKREQRGITKPTFSERYHDLFVRHFDKLQGRYQRGIAFFFRHHATAIVLTILALGAFGWLMATTKTGLVPSEDMGSINISVQTAAGSSLKETSDIMHKIDEGIKDIPEIKAYSKVIGTGRNSGQGSSYGMFVIRLKNWNERRGSKHSQDAVTQKIYKATADIKDAKIMAQGQPMISGYGASNGFELYIQDKKGGSIDELNGYTQQFLKALNDRPEVSRAQTSFDTKYPQYRLDVDAALCKQKGVSPSDVLSCLSGYIGGNYASNFNRFSKLYRVMVQASPKYRLDEQSINNMFVRTSSGEMSPVGQFITLKRIYGSESLTRFNLFNAIKVNGNPAMGYSSGQCLKAIAEVASQTLPEGYGYEYSGMSREESEGSGAKTVLVFLACTIFIYLILCALYESVCIPWAVILSVPFGLAGSFLFARLFGIENNIYMQTGVIMLIGMLAKTAILLTEYASERRAMGMGIVEAAKDAAKVRLRPILMTSLTMIFGLLPMIFANGAGANGDRSLALGTAGGMFVGTIALLFVVPVLFVIMQKLEERMPKVKRDGMAMLLIVLASGLAFSSCGTYKRYERPDIAEKWMDELGQANAQMPQPWQGLFDDECLHALILQGLDQNADLQIALLKVTEAEAMLRSSKLSYLPSIGIDAQGQLRQFAHNAVQRTYSIGPSASWELDLFGQLTNAKRGAQAALLAKQAFAKAVRTRVVAQIADAYYTLLLLDKQLEIDDQTLRNWERNIHILQVLKQTGQTNEIAIAQATNNKLALEKAIVELKAHISNTENSLCTLIGEQGHAIARGKLDNVTLASDLCQGIGLEAAANRPDVLEAEFALQEATYNMQAARTAFYPHITLSGSLGWTNNGNGIGNPGDWLWNALGNLTQPLFSRGSLHAKYKVSQAQQKEALHAFHATLLNAGEEMNAALTSWQSARERVALDAERTKLMSQAVRQTEILMQHSSINYLEVLTAQQALLSAENNLAQDQYDMIQALIQLYHCMGGED